MVASFRLEIQRSINGLITVLYHLGIDRYESFYNNGAVCYRCVTKVAMPAKTNAPNLSAVPTSPSGNGEHIMAEYEWMTTSEAAEVTGYHRDHIQRLCRTGAVECRLTKAGYIVFMPSLRTYTEERGWGPHNQPDNPDESEGRSD